MAGTNHLSDKSSRQDRRIKERVHDPYQMRSKPTEPTRCPDCGAMFSAGRWQWTTRQPAEAATMVCPSCQRIRDRQPAGILTLKGPFFTEHRREIMNLVQNKVDGQKADHPLKRIMSMEDQDDGSLRILFTDNHLPRGVGQAIESAYDGTLDIQYSEEAALVRVYWER